MRNVVERVAEMRPDHELKRLSTLDRAFDNIGTDRDRWLA